MEVKIAIHLDHDLEWEDFASYLKLRSHCDIHQCYIKCASVRENEEPIFIISHIIMALRILSCVD